MKVLMLKEDMLMQNEYPNDVDRIVKVCKEKNLFIDRGTAGAAWEIFSEEYYFAQWMSMDDISDQAVLDSIMLVTDIRRF